MHGMVAQTPALGQSEQRAVDDATAARAAAASAQRFAARRASRSRSSANAPTERAHFLWKSDIHDDDAQRDEAPPAKRRREEAAPPPPLVARRVDRPAGRATAVRPVVVCATAVCGMLSFKTVAVRPVCEEVPSEEVPSHVLLEGTVAVTALAGRYTPTRNTLMFTITAAPVRTKATIRAAVAWAAPALTSSGRLDGRRRASDGIPRAVK